MNRILFLVTFFCTIIGVSSHANEIDYRNCKSIQDVIEIESREIANTHPSNHDELAQLHASRGESYLLNSQYEKAIEDFQNANSQLGYSNNLDSAMVIAFRSAFGQAVSYDNLGMHEQTQKALEQLQTIAGHVGCDDCIEHRPCQDMTLLSANRSHIQGMIRPTVNTMHFRDLISTCKHKKDKKREEQPQQLQQENQDSYDDILGPNQPPDSSWCEEIVVGVATSMQVIADLAPTWIVKSALVGILEGLKHRAIRCCQAGGFWKACVAPITRKWREWKNNKERYLLPNAENLHLYIT